MADGRFFQPKPKALPSDISHAMIYAVVQLIAHLSISRGKGVI